jgi:hypothetical protein
VKQKTLKEEAEEFQKKKAATKRPVKKKVLDRPLTSVDHMAGLILSGLLANGRSALQTQEELKEEAYEWAEMMLKDD